MFDMRQHHHWNARRVDELRAESRQRTHMRSLHPTRQRVAQWLRATAERIEPTPRHERLVT